MSFDNLVFARSDQFADFVEEQPDVGSYVHIRIQQRNGRKSLTTVQGLADDLDLKKILKALKKMFSTNGTILVDADMGNVLQLQGDQRKNVAEFLVKFKICAKGEVKIHGF
jgi:translation initiation factor 1